MVFSISREKRSQLYKKVESITPNKDIYFPDHVEIVAKKCLYYGKKLQKNDPLICELGGLLHDVGYTKEYESVEEDHIKRGCKIAYNFLKEFKIDKFYIDRIVDCIWTHDGNLNRSKYLTNNKPPLENIIVNDVDSLCLFEWPIPSLIEFCKRIKPERNLAEVVSTIIGHAHQTLNYIYDDYFKKLASSKYKNFIKKLEEWK